MKLIAFQYLKKMGKQKKFFIPCIFTLFNACAGFFSLIKTLQYDFNSAVYFIIVAACFDMLDGRVARALKSTSAIGMELDSLADAISFCVAPVFLLYTLYFADAGMTSLIILSLYMCSGLSRLARFNVIEPDYLFSKGLPVPVAAICIVQCVLQEAWLSQFFMRVCGISLSTGIIGIVIGIALLMISTVRYPTFKRMSFQSLTYVLFFALCLTLLFLYYKSPLILSYIVAYILLGWIGVFIF